MHNHLNTLQELYKSEKQPFRKVHRMIDLFESIIKTHTVVILSSYVQHNELSDEAKGMLSQGLRTPSLGTWQLFSRVLFQELQSRGFNFFINDFVNDFIELDKALNVEKTNVIAFRNGYAHGATPSDDKCLEDIKKYEPFLNQLIELKWLKNSDLEVRDGKVCVTSEKVALSLHPILLYREEKSDASFAFFNDLKNDKIGLLNYPLGKLYREKDFYKEFHEYLPLHEWKKTGNNEFYQRIDELTETFKGRTAEREKLLNFVLKKNKGYFSIQGNPGIGKSALIAQFFKDLKAQKEIKNVQVVEYFIRRGTQQAQIYYLLNYLIKRTDEVFPQGREIRAEGKMVFDLQHQLFSKWRLWAEHSKGNKLLLLIDGLDEGVENNVVNYIPRENFENILFIYGSRPGGHKSIDELWATLPAEHHTKLELTGLSKEDIRALIYEVANKYEVERDSPWIDAVQQRSQGNPLYLKLLCDAIENGSIALNDIKALPEKIDEYYKAILQRYAHDMDGDALLAGLYTFAAAKDYLTVPHLGLINKLGDATLERVGSTLKEVLYENPLTEEVLDYQLFHESFREYLVKEKALKVTEATERILDFCSTWKDLEGSREQRYALEHFALHLYENKKIARHTELLNLIHNEAYTTAQKQVLKQFNATKDLYQLNLKKASELQLYDAQLEAALCLVDLKYEEANDAPQVVALVTNGEIDLALKRIESFGGNDKEGLERKFILYMLCLMELTLLESKEKPFRKEGIENLLRHLDEQIPEDHSILNWNDFFPSYIMFLMASEWNELGLDYLIVLRRSDDWDKDWIEVKGPYTNNQFLVFKELAFGISIEHSKRDALKYISNELAKQMKLEEALEYARVMPVLHKIKALSSISTELKNQDNLKEATFVMKEAYECVRGISDNFIKSRAFLAIYSELALQGSPYEANTARKEALENLQNITDERIKSRVLSELSSELAKQCKFEEAFKCAQGIGEDYFKCEALSEISFQLAKHGKLKVAEIAIQEARACINGISDDFMKNHAFWVIATQLAKQGKFQKAIESAQCISDYYVKSYALSDITTELAKKGNIEEALVCSRDISDDKNKSFALKHISTELVKQGMTRDALACVQAIKTHRSKTTLLKNIASELAKKESLVESATAMQENLKSQKGINVEYDKNLVLRSLSIELAKQGKLEESLNCTRCITNYYQKSIALSHISSELSMKGEFLKSDYTFQESLKCARSIKDNLIKVSTLSEISTKLTNQGRLKESADIIKEAFEYVFDMNYDSDKIDAVLVISTELTNQGKQKEAGSAIDEALKYVRNIFYEPEKSIALSDIAIELAKQCKFEKALKYVRCISEDYFKCKALSVISSELTEQVKLEETKSVIQEALACARGISYDFDKSNALKDISIELAKQGNLTLTETIGLEISQLAERHSTWKTIAGNNYKKLGWQKALQQVNQLQSDEARLFYFKGWAEAVSQDETDAVCVQEALSHLAHDSESIENLLQKYALYELFFGTDNEELVNRLNKSLNIQWAIDIKAQFNREEEGTRLSTNVDEWLHEITDEDDQERVELWAMKVAKGKMTEQDFTKKINSIKY